MTEIDALKYKLEQQEKAYNKLHKMYISLLKQQGELEKENEQLKSFKSRVFNLLQDEIREESELLDYYLKEKALYNADRQQTIVGVLKRLKKELEE